MFEDALVESGGQLKNRSNWWTLASLTFYSVIFGGVILLPLLNPEMLPHQLLKDFLVAPPVPVAPTALPNRVAENHSGSTGGPTLNLRTPLPLIATNSHPVLTQRGTESDVPPGGGYIPGADFGSGNNGNGIPFGGPNGIDSRPPAPRVATPHGPAHVSDGVMAGYALYHPEPPYPQIAKVTRTQGVVVLEVTISRSGEMEGVHVISGNPMLITSAVDTVKSWRYRPYLLNGEPVEVQMQVTVRFTLDG
jgi:protein TonB